MQAMGGEGGRGLLPIRLKSFNWKNGFDWCIWWMKVLFIEKSFEILLLLKSCVEDLIKQTV